MTTYIINLKKDEERRKHMKDICSKYHLSNYEFVEAVYGKDLSADEINTLFDLKLAYKRYGRDLILGEIGCTLSHYKCYKKLINSDEPYALILEDDITILRDLSILPIIQDTCTTTKPTILFLSGDYWYYSKKLIGGGTHIANVYDAVGSYAYIINRAGAELILSKNRKPSNVADHWSLYRRQGLNLYAAYPYTIDANIESFESSIEQSSFGENRRQMPLSMLIPAYWNAFVKKILLKTGRFVSKIRKR